MIDSPMDVLRNYPIRKSGKQKKAFRDAVVNYAKSLGYEVTVEKGSMFSQNVVIGNPEKAKYLVTAHYDTPAVLPFPNLITPCSFWGFWGYQLIVIFVMIAAAAAFAGLLLLIFKNLFITIETFGLSLLAASFLMMFGPANKNNANDNTSGVVTVLETAKKLPEVYRDQVCFILFDLEEAGLLGSSGYASRHKKQVKNQLILNLDCVGDGNEVIAFPNKKVKKNADYMSVLDALETVCGEKSLKVRRKGFSMFPSDQANFRYGVAFAAMNRTKGGTLYCDKIHTPKDTVLDEENVRMISDSLCNALTGSAENHAKGEKIHE